MSNKTITIYQAHGRRGVGNQARGFIQPFIVEPGDTAALAAAVEYDNCFAEYKDGHRTGDKFLMANAILADVDNSHSDDPADWIMPEDVQAAFPNVMHYQYPSRNNMRPKDGRTPRPKFHNVFPIEQTTDVKMYIRYMTTMIERFPQLHFDAKVKSAAQLNFGSEGAEVTYTDGEINLTDFLAGACQSNVDAGRLGADDITPFESNAAKVRRILSESITIPEGERDKTLNIGALCLIKRQGGDTEESRTEYEKLVSLCEGELDPGQAEKCYNSALKKFQKDIENRPDYDPDKFSADAQSDFSLKPSDFTDVGQALILSREYGDRLRYSPATNYLVYSGQVWEENAARARGCMHELTERQLAENTPLYIASTNALEKAEQTLQAVKQGGSDADKQNAAKSHAKAKRDYAPVTAYQTFILKRRNSKEITGVMKEAQTPLEISVSALDANGFMLNTPGGEVDLRTGEIKPHNPESFHTKITAVAPNADGSDIWRDFLNVITCGRPDLADYLQITSGAELVGRVYVEMLIIAYGGGRNGKSTFYNTISRVLGDYSGQISAETLTTGRKNGKNWELAELRGKRLIVAPELEEGTRLDSAFVKKISSTDEILGEQKYKTPFKFQPSHTTVLYTNHLPRIGSCDAGTWRRIVVIPFDAVIEGKSDIKNYTDHLFRHAGGAALMWAIAGAKRFINAGYHIKPPECVREAIAQYREQNDWLSNFLSECCELDKRYREKSSVLYNRYRDFCAQLGDYTRSSQDFKTAIEGAGYETKRTAAGTIVHGLKVISDFLS
jgi:P4 family phage/plasmid primase-like protien